jgi:hypothetical protein
VYMIAFGVGVLSLDKSFANAERPVEGECSSHEAVSYQRKQIVHIDRRIDARVGDQCWVKDHSI